MGDSEITNRIEKVKEQEFVRWNTKLEVKSLRREKKGKEQHIK